MRPADDRPRLLLLTPDFPPARGGIQVMAHRLAATMTAFRIRVVASPSPGAAGFDAAAALDTRRAGLGGGAPARAVSLNAGAVAHALAFRPAVTLDMHLLTAPAAAVVRAAAGARTVQYFHANEIPARPRLAAFAARRADVVVVVSSYTAGLVRATGAQPADMRIIPPGVDLPRGGAPASTGRAGRPTVLTVSRLLDGYKGHDVLIAALAAVRERVPDVQWIVVGDGPLRSRLEEQARAAGIGELVKFLGAVGDAERDAWLGRAHVYAMPSRIPADGRAGEGFGIVYMEASAHGIPVVAGNVAGALDAVLAGETGLLVDPTDAHAVAEAIAELLLDRERAAALGRRGAERARQFAWPAIASRVQDLLLETIAHRPGGGGPAG